MLWGFHHPTASSEQPRDWRQGQEQTEKNGGISELRATSKRSDINIPWERPGTPGCKMCVRNDPVLVWHRAGHGVLNTVIRSCKQERRALQERKSIYSEFVKFSVFLMFVKPMFQLQHVLWSESCRRITLENLLDFQCLVPAYGITATLKGIIATHTAAHRSLVLAGISYPSEPGLWYI